LAPGSRSSCEGAEVRYGLKCGKLGFTVIFYRTEIPVPGHAVGKEQSSGTSGTPTLVPDVPEDAPAVKAKDAIVECMAENPNVTHDGLSAAISLGRKTVQRHIRSLKDEGQIRRVGSDRAGHWEITE
jgi:predicted HTH transcriptional regulator